MDSIVVRGDIEDRFALQKFLEKAKVPYDELIDQMELFSLLKNEHGDILGTIGFEIHQSSGLLRSLVVHPTVNEKQMILLFKSTFAIAKEKGLKELIIVTHRKEAKPFFKMLGFQETDAEDISPSILESYENKIEDIVDNGLYIMKIHIK